ncbi:hypothetical protein [uncultured Tateyamaria sp.]|uniref:hypothetical protein n=1 Tax=uncultured Tateyamaria sp. TaxID=455651 RepID=UPI0026271178|nr:hypothetical protein [uncultured Tateyamaria sp.]
MRAVMCLVIVGLLAACTGRVDRTKTYTQPGLPPLGLAATAAWLDAREARAPQRLPASAVPTSQIRSTVGASH